MKYKFNFAFLILILLAILATSCETETVSKSFDLAVSKIGTGEGSILSAPNGIDCGATCSASFKENIEVVLTASNAVGSNFSAWSNGCITSAASIPSSAVAANTCTVKMDAAKTITATFTKNSDKKFNLAVKTSGNGSGSVTSTPTGISCNTTCNTDFNAGIKVNLTATPAQGSKFVGWSGACTGTTCTLTMDKAQEVTAEFQKDVNPSKQFTLKVNLSGSGTGSVSSSPAGIDCKEDCEQDYDKATKVTLTAKAVDGSSFTGWSGDCTGTAVCEVSMTKAKTVTANFETTKKLTVGRFANSTAKGSFSSSPIGIDCDQNCAEDFANYPKGTTVTITASPAQGAFVSKWSGNCTIDPNNKNICVLKMDQDNLVSVAFANHTDCLIDPPNIPDVKVQTIIKQTLGLANTATISCANLKDLTSFQANNSPNPALDLNLEGLQYASNLSFFTTHYYNLSGLSLLKHLPNLEKITISHSSNLNVSDFSDFLFINFLALANNQISDISGLTNLPNLKYLSLFSNQVVNISALSALTSLERLIIPNNQITDISPLMSLDSLWELNLDNNPISDFSKLSTLTSLTKLNIRFNLVTDVSWISGLTNLSLLNLFGSTVSNISALVSNSGLGSGDTIVLNKNCLDTTVGSTSLGHINTLIGRGANVLYADQKAVCEVTPTP